MASVPTTYLLAMSVCGGLGVQPLHDDELRYLHSGGPELRNRTPARRSVAVHTELRPTARLGLRFGQTMSRFSREGRRHALVAEWAVFRRGRALEVSGGVGAGWARVIAGSSDGRQSRTWHQDGFTAEARGELGWSPVNDLWVTLAVVGRMAPSARDEYLGIEHVGFSGADAMLGMRFGL